MTRILTALVGIPLLLAVILYFPPYVFLVLTCVSVILGSFEFFALALKFVFDLEQKPLRMQLNTVSRSQ